MSLNRDSFSCSLIFLRFPSCYTHYEDVLISRGKYLRKEKAEQESKKALANLAMIFRLVKSVNLLVQRPSLQFPTSYLNVKNALSAYVANTVGGLDLLPSFTSIS